MNKIFPSKRALVALYILAVLTAICLIAMIIILCIPKDEVYGEFTPPPFDENAKEGEPTIPEWCDYLDLYQTGAAYTAAMSLNLKVSGDQLIVYFTNYDKNNVNLKLRVLDSNENVIAQTGLVRPGEYIESISLSKKVSVGDKVRLVIMGYEPESYNSMGVMKANTQIYSVVD